MIHTLGSLASAAVVLVAFLALLRVGVGVVAGGRGRSGAMRFPRSYRRQMRGGRGPLLWGLIIVTKTLVYASRFAFGLPLNGTRKTDATLFRSGRNVIDEGDGILMRGPSWWSFLPYWQRAATRWGAVVAVGCYLKWPLPTTVVGGVLVAAAAYFAGRRWLARFRVRKHMRELVRPLFAALAPYMKLDEFEEPGEWIEIPASWQTSRGAQITLHYPEGWDPDQRRKTQIEGVVARFIGDEWEADWGTFEATWRRAPLPPVRVDLAEVEQAHGKDDAFLVPVGMQARDRVAVIDMRRESPHWLVTAPPGGGKTSTLRVPIARNVPRGWLVDIIDFRQDSFVELDDVPNVRIHTDIQSAVFALSEFYVSMKGAQDASRYQRMTESEIRPRMLVIDEFGSFMILARSWWNRYKQKEKLKGDAPFLDAFKVMAMQGRAGNHRMVVGVHDADAGLFGGTGVRSLFANRAMVGAMDRWKWAKTFGKAARIEYDPEIEGRGALGLGEFAVKETQFAWVSPEENRSRCLTAPPPPAWFTDFQLAPWVTLAVLAQAEEEVGLTLIPPHGRTLVLPGETTGDVPPEDVETSPTSPTVGPPPAYPGDAYEESRKEGAQETPKNAPEKAPGRPPLRSVKDGDEPWIVGYQEAAEFLTSAGWPMKPDTFKRVRNKEKNNGNPIHGETRTADDKPCWIPSELVAWQKRRKIAGKRQFQDAEAGQ